MRQTTEKKHVALITKAREYERNEIGRELHDNVNQLLATAKLMLDTALSVPELQEECLTRSREIVVKTMDEVRELSHSLMQPTFKQHNLKQSVQEIRDHLLLASNLFVEVLLADNDQLEQLGDGLQLSLYRIIQEQVNNILKHAQATTLLISIEFKGKYVYLTIKDNGIGADLTEGYKGIGLRNIQSRVRVLKGEMKICTAPNKGFKLVTRIPIIE